MKIKPKNGLLSLFLNILIFELLALFVVFLSYSITGDNLVFSTVLGQSVIAIMFIVMLYGSMWYEGDRDRPMTSDSKSSSNPLQGFKIGLIVMSPFLLANILLVLSKLGVIFNFLALYRLGNLHISPTISLLTSLPNEVVNIEVANRSVSSIKFISDATELPWSAVVIMVSTMLVFPIICGLGYYFGFKGINLKNHILYRGKNND